MLPVVEAPVAVIDPPLGVELPEKRRSRERREDRVARQIDLRRDRELRGAEKHVGSVVVHPEDEASLQCDAMAMQGLDDAGVVGRVVEPLTRFPQRGG